MGSPIIPQCSSGHLQHQPEVNLRTQTKAEDLKNTLQPLPRVRKALFYVLVHVHVLDGRASRARVTLASSHTSPCSGAALTSSAMHTCGCTSLFRARCRHSSQKPRRESASRPHQPPPSICRGRGRNFVPQGTEVFTQWLSVLCMR